MSLGKETFGLNKKQFTEKISLILKNFRVNSRLIGESRKFVLRACALTTRWKKLAMDPETVVIVRNVEISGGRRVRMICLERTGTRQPVSKSQLIDSLYPVKKIATSATPEEKHYNAVRSAMRNGINYQLKEFRDNVPRPITCRLSGKILRKGMRTDVDHCEIPFAQIADNFLREEGLCYVDVFLVGSPNNKRFKDKELWDRWQLYHLDTCKLSLVCSSANRSKGSEGYSTPPELIGSYDKGEEEESLSLEF